MSGFDGAGLVGVQIGLNSRDIAGTAQLYADAFGFANAGGTLIWGPPMVIQDLDASARGMIWWLVGRQRFFQLEIFHHTEPAQRPLRDDWICSDIGWSRFGVAVGDFDRVCRVLAAFGISLSPVIARAGLRRCAFRDPFIGCFVEVLEDGVGVPGGRPDGRADLDPAIVYATSSVTDIDAARIFYETTLGLPIADLATLRGDEDEASFGLSNMSREGFVADAGAMLIEVVRYSAPVGRPKPSDYRSTDQGMVNIALGARDKRVVESALTRIEAGGARMSPIMTFGDALGCYVFEGEREIELIALPEALDAAWGYEPTTPFIGSMGGPEN